VVRVDVGERPNYRTTGTQSLVDRYGPVQSFEGCAIVRSDGLVRRLYVSFVTTYRSDPVQVRYTSVYTRLGNATVEPPEWLSTARERTA